MDVTEETFNVNVVERSRSVPVILDLWAEWCEPCKQLSPVLEKLAGEADGDWVLAKVDIDANPQLRAALQVQSIPMVMAVAGGQVVDGFLGAMPEAQVRQWLGQVMQVAGQLGLPGAAARPGRRPAISPETASRDGQPGGQPGGGPGGGPGHARRGAGPAWPADPAFDEAQQAMERGDLDAAAAAFERVLAAAPGHPVATVGLAQVDLIRRVSSYDEGQVRRDAAEHPGDVNAQARVAELTWEGPPGAPRRASTGCSVRSGAPRERTGSAPGCTWSGCSTCFARQPNGHQGPRQPVHLLF